MSNPVTEIKRFYLQRDIDETGISGTGIVATGVVLPSGKCVLEWLTFHSSVCFYSQFDDIEKIHSHAGKTKVVLVQDKEEVKVKKHGRKKSNNL